MGRDEPLVANGRSGPMLAVDPSTCGPPAEQVVIRGSVNELVSKQHLSYREPNENGEVGF